MRKEWITKLELATKSKRNNRIPQKNSKITTTMKLLIVTGFFASAADGALSTMRVGPRKAIRGDHGYEFGRPVDVIDADAA